MIHIDNLKEKELVIAYYFCGNTHKQFSRYEVFDMWSNWFKKDFRINNKPVFCIIDNKLAYRKFVKIKRNDMETLKQYNQAFQNIYTCIKKMLSEKGHDKTFLRQELEKERKREYKRVIRVAKPLNIYISMNTKNTRLAEFMLHNYGEWKGAITSGDCDKMIKYMNKKLNQSRKNSWQTYTDSK